MRERKGEREAAKWVCGESESEVDKSPLGDKDTDQGSQGVPVPTGVA